MLLRYITSLTSAEKLTGSFRAISTTAAVFGRRSRDPYDRRFGINPKDAGKHGGTKEIAMMFTKTADAPQIPGYYDKNGIFTLVPEMIPEFIVPDLKDFKLKPYVSYRVADVTQNEFTAKDLFDATYAKEIVDEYKSGKLDDSQIKVRVEKLRDS